MFGKLFAIDLSLLLAVGIGCIVTLTIEHGWSWVLAKYKENKARVQAQGQGALDQVKTFGDRMKALEADVAAVKTKLGL